MTPLLRAELERVLQNHFGDSRSVSLLTRRESPYRSSHNLEELEVELDDGTSLSVMLKAVGNDALSTAARSAKPSFLYDPMREIATYRRLLPEVDLDTAVCYGTSIEPAEGRFWLFLEKVDATELYDVGEFEAWEAAARWLAGFHSRFARDGERWCAPCRLLRFGPEYFRMWPRRAAAFGDHLAGRTAALQWLVSRYEGVVDRLLALPMAVLHGEFYASNILVGRGEGELRICPIDWEMTAWGPAPLDVAALCSGKWTEEDRRAMALEYRSSLEAEVLAIPSEDDLL